MLRTMKKNISSTINLKIISGILGVSFWLYLNNVHTKTITLDVPVCFYNQPENLDLIAPSILTVKLAGKRIDLKTLDVSSLALHIDASTLHEGTNSIIVDSTTLFLPHTIKMINYTPANGVIQCNKKNTTSLPHEPTINQTPTAHV